MPVAKWWSHQAGGRRVSLKCCEGATQVPLDIFSIELLATPGNCPEGRTCGRVEIPSKPHGTSFTRPEPRSSSWWTSRQNARRLRGDLFARPAPPSRDIADEGREHGHPRSRACRPRRLVFHVLLGHPTPPRTLSQAQRPENLGSCLSTNAMTASRWSSVRPECTWWVTSRSRHSSRGPLTARLRFSFM
jgi:hypothetical protein